MKFEYFIFQKISKSIVGSFSAFIIKICTAAIALSISVMIIATCLVDGFQYEIQNKVTNFWAHIHIRPYSLTRSLSESPIGLDHKLIHNINQIPEVKQVKTAAYKGGILKTDEAFEGIILRGLSIAENDPFRSFVKSGRLIQVNPADSTALPEIMLSKTTLEKMKLKLGQKVLISFMGNQIQLRKFKIVGTYGTGIETFDNQYAMVDIGFIQKLNHWTQDSIGAYEVFVKQLSEVHRTKQKIAELIQDPNLEIQAIQEIKPDIFDWLGLQKTNERIILILMFFVAVINMATALLILILERTNMIGILKALGGSNTSIHKIFLIQAFHITFKGIIWGNIIGWSLCLIQYQFHLITLPEESYYISYAPIYFNIGKILLISLSTLLFSTLLMVIPVTLISKISPIKVIEYA